ncbi:hypothetical protein [Actinopolyspora halophila]|uniref:hypothetical protein n=1 Tax=Actinopolyspora halophila TaxID=1850 RepID=UPI000364FA29|nr:hypothetical protein [Actinopolyspora halophila]
MTATSQPKQHRGPFGPGFELFADMLGIGVATTLASLPVVTTPAAVSTACAQLRARSRGGRGPGGLGYARQFLRRLRGERVLPDLTAGVLALVTGALLALDLLLTRTSSGFPGQGFVTVILFLVALTLVPIGLRAVALPESEHDWRAALTTAARTTATDPGGSVLLFGAVAVSALCVWMLPVLAVLILGPLSLAATAVEERRPRRGSESSTG